MKNHIVAITMIKNEADIIESFVRHTLLFADALVIADHRSTDGTMHILEELMKEGLALRLQNLTEEGHAQSKTMTRLMYVAIEEEKADIVVALDADEFLLSEGAGNDETRNVLQSLNPSQVYHVPWVDYAPLDMTSEVIRLYCPVPVAGQRSRINSQKSLLERMPHCVGVWRLCRGIIMRCLMKSKGAVFCVLLSINVYRNFILHIFDGVAWSNVFQKKCAAGCQMQLNFQRIHFMRGIGNAHSRIFLMGKCLKRIPFQSSMRFRPI